MRDRPNPEPSAKRTRWAPLLLLIELVMLLIAVVISVTPTKTGSRWSPSSVLTEEPSVVLDVALWFAAMHFFVIVMTMVAGVVAWITRRTGATREQ